MLDNERILMCPACHKKLAKLELKSIGVTIDVCLDGCGGIYFDNKVMPLVLKSADAMEKIRKACEGKEFKIVDRAEIRRCPFCGTNMVKNYTSYSKEIQIDECYRCGGKFLDCGELEKIKAQDPEENTEAIMKEVRNMLDIDFKLINAENRYRNKRRSFFTKIAEMFLQR